MTGYCSARRAAAGDDVFRVGYFARIAPEKGLHVLAEAYQHLPRTAPAPAPPITPRGGRLHRRARRRRISRTSSASSTPAGLAGEFTYHGAVDRDGKLAFLQTLDVLSVPATYDEPKGVFLLEAMASGVPVVQPRRGAFTEIVEKTGGGLLVAPDDPAALADGLYRAVAGSRRTADALGARGFDGVRAHYSIAALRRSAARGVRGADCRAPMPRSSARRVERRLGAEVQTHAERRSPQQGISDAARPARRAVGRVVLAGARRRGGDHGAVGQRQELAALHPRRARAADLRDGHARRPQSVRAARRPQLAAFRNESDRLRLPGSLPAAAVHGARERADPDAGRVRRRTAAATRARARDAHRAGRPRGSHRSSARRAVGRRAAARRDRARADRAAAAAAVRRADRQPRSRRRRTASRRCCSICIASSRPS